MIGRALIAVGMLLALCSCEESGASLEALSVSGEEQAAGPILDPEWTTIFDNGDLLWRVDANSIRYEENIAVFRAKTSIANEVMESETDLFGEVDCDQQLYREFQSYTTSPHDYMTGADDQQEWRHIAGGTPLSSLYNYVCHGLLPTQD